MAKKLSQKRKRMKYRQYRRQLKDESCMTLNFMYLEESIPTITELLDSPISNYITLAANVLEVYLMGIYGLSPSPGYRSRGDGQTTIQFTAEYVPHSTRQQY